MKKFNIDKLLLCFGIFFVSIFGVGMIDSYAATISEDEFNSYTNKYILIRKFSYISGSQFDCVQIFGSDKPFYLPDNYNSIGENGKLYFKDENGNDITLDVYKKEVNTYESWDSNGNSLGFKTKTEYTKSTSNNYQYYKMQTEKNGPMELATFDKYIVSSNFDLKTVSGSMVFQNNPLKEVKQVGEAVKNQTKVILPIAIFLMGCLLLVQILRRVLVRFSIG